MDGKKRRSLPGLSATLKDGSRELTIDGQEGRETEEQRELNLEFTLLLKPQVWH